MLKAGVQAYPGEAKGLGAEERGICLKYHSWMGLGESCHWSPRPKVTRSRHTHPLVVIHYDASGANGEGGGGAGTLTQGQALLGFRPRNAHLQDLGEGIVLPGIPLSPLVSLVLVPILSPLYSN